MGITRGDDCYNMAVSVREGRSLSLMVYDRKDGHRAGRISIPEEYRIGDVYAFTLKGSDLEKYSYSYYDGQKLFCDPYSRALDGCGRWGSRRERSLFLHAEEYDWGDEKKPSIPLSDCIMYTIHVRGFTRHSSSGVKYPGTFEGIIEKIPYLRELGINQVELMPAYDFNEIIRHPDLPGASHLMKGSIEEKQLEEELEKKKRSRSGINYWGYTDEAYYFAPKAAYSGINDPDTSMKNLVKALHEAGIELVMQMYFPVGTLPQLIVDCIRLWVMVYHIDGVNVMGQELPEGHILADPLLADTKIYMRSLDAAPAAFRRNRALVQDGFMYDMRRFLKSDEDMTRSFVSHLLDNPSDRGVINFITNYYGFTLRDLVSYDRKHNEDNGEDNRDGTDYNYSWNCGMEGLSRRKYVRALRQRQAFNALSFLFLSSGVPKLMAGDEMGNTQYGNNNAYCQDNRITWLDWSGLEKFREVYAFIKEFIAFRKKSSILHMGRPLAFTDTSGVGLPEVSFHGEQAWFPHYENYSRTLGCMMASRGEYIFSAFNMYWIEEKFALPKLPKGKKWYLVMKTTDGFVYEEEPLEDQDVILVGGRTVVMLAGR